MSIFDNEQILEFNPYNLLEMVISVSSSIDNSENHASQNFIKSYQKTGKDTYDDSNIEKSIESNINLLITTYNDTDNQMRNWLKDMIDDNHYLDEKDNEFIKKILSEKPIMIQHYPYLQYGFDLFDDFTDKLSKVQNDNDIKNAYKEFLNKFSEKTSFKIVDDKNIYNFEFLNSKSEVTPGTWDNVNKFITDSFNNDWFNNKAPEINADYYTKLKALKMISTYKAVLYSLYKAFITDYTSLIGRV